MKIERENIFLVGDILCKKDCRFGLTATHFERCCHVELVRVEALALELVEHEQLLVKYDLLQKELIKLKQKITSQTFRN